MASGRRSKSAIFYVISKVDFLIFTNSIIGHMWLTYLCFILFNYRRFITGDVYTSKKEYNVVCEGVKEKRLQLEKGTKHGFNEIKKARRGRKQIPTWNRVSALRKKVEKLVPWNKKKILMSLNKKKKKEKRKEKRKDEKIQHVRENRKSQDDERLSEYYKKTL